MIEYSQTLKLDCFTIFGKSESYDQKFCISLYATVDVN
jgi:hypothetical protein